MLVGKCKWKLPDLLRMDQNHPQHFPTSRGGSVVTANTLEHQNPNFGFSISCAALNVSSLNKEVSHERLSSRLRGLRYQIGYFADRKGQFRAFQNATECYEVCKVLCDHLQVRNTHLKVISQKNFKNMSFSKFRFFDFSKTTP